jgi:WD40 repeat protein
MQAFVNSETLVTYGTSGNMQMWNCGELSLSDSGARETLELEHPPVYTATSSNGRLLATVSANSHTVVRDPVTLAIMHEMPVRFGSRVRSASFSGDCRLLAVVLQDSSITIWDVTRNEIMWQPQGRGMMAAVDAHHVGVNGCFLSEVSPPCYRLAARFAAPR